MLHCYLASKNSLKNTYLYKASAYLHICIVIVVFPVLKIMDSSIEIVPVPHDPELEKAKSKTKTPYTFFGEIAVGPRRVMFPKPYAKWAEKVLNMEVRSDDVWVVSLPRSGTTWTTEMVWLLCNNLDYDAAKNNILDKRFLYLELAAMSGDAKLEDTFRSIDEMANVESPRFIKTHVSLELLPKQLWTVKPKTIYVYRNPKDVVISQYHFSRMINKYEGTFEEFADIFIQDKCIYSPFWTHVLDFWELQKKGHVLFLTYEQMKEDLLSVVYKTANYLGTSLTSEQAEKLAEHLDYKSMKHNRAVNQEERLTKFKIVAKPDDANYIRKGRSGEWREKMKPEMIAKFDSWSKKYIDGTDFDFYE